MVTSVADDGDGAGFGTAVQDGHARAGAGSSGLFWLCGGQSVQADIMHDDGIEQWEERLRSGDEAALAMLWSLHRDRLLRLVRYRLDPRLPRRVDADDLLQESYLAARQRLARFGADGFRSSFVWLRLIVVQSLIDHHRHHLGAEMRAADREQADAGSDADSSAAALVARLSAAGPSPSHRLRA
jgi:RNA polymerase sigma-70 factor (ECF subfamily)